MASNARDKAEESGRGLVETLRDNPIPAAMIAGGIGWLLFNKRRHRADHAQVSRASDQSVALESGLYADSIDAENIDYSREMPGIRDEGVAHRVADGAKHAGERVASTAKDAGSRVASTARAVGERVSAQHGARNGGAIHPCHNNARRL